MTVFGKLTKKGEKIVSKAFKKPLHKISSKKAKVDALGPFDVNYIEGLKQGELEDRDIDDDEIILLKIDEDEDVFILVEILKHQVPCDYKNMCSSNIIPCYKGLKKYIGCDYLEKEHGYNFYQCNYWREETIYVPQYKFDSHIQELKDTGFLDITNVLKINNSDILLYLSSLFKKPTTTKNDLLLDRDHEQNEGASHV